jgi:WD40 repeat protein/tRNA A-37 threonylcarbamoyl transferase component Bud32
MDPSESSECDKLVDEIQMVWEQSPTNPDLASLLNRSRPLTPPEWLEVCLVDQSYRCRTDQPLRVEDYLLHCPSLRDDPELIFELAYGELRIRRQLQETWPPGEIEARFPTLATRLHKQLEVGSWLAQAASFPTPPGTSPIGSDVHLSRLGKYELSEPFAQGGMGMIFRARHVELNRVVALKMIRPDRVAGEVDRRRFQNESVIIAQFDHPHIVPIYDVGEEQGVHYFAMKLLEGGDLQQHSRRYLDDPRAAAQIMADVGDAVHHAHQRGVLHRDMKPSNILLDEAGRPHVTDFGLARSLDGQHQLTNSGDLLGTPAYLAPEQLTPGQGPLTIAADVYGLGAVLYTLLTGRPPFESQHLVTTLESIQHRDPVSPHRLNPHVDRDLESICFKALAKRPADRYSSARTFADDLQRYLAGESIQARPASWWQRRWSWIRRHPDLAIATSLLLLVGTALLIILSWQALRLRQLRLNLDTSLQVARVGQVEAESNRSEAARLRQSAQALQVQAEEAQSEALEQMQRAREASYAATIRDVDDARRSGDTATFSQLLDRLIPSADQQDVRGFEWFWLARHRPRAQHWQLLSQAVRSVRYSPDGRWLAAAGDPGMIQVWDAKTGQAVRSWPSFTTIRNLAFSQDGRLLAAVGGDGWLRIFALDGTVSRQWKLADVTLWHVAFVGDEPLLATCDQDGNIRLIDGLEGKTVATLETPNRTVQSIAVEPQGRWLISGDEKGNLLIWDLALRQIAHRIELHADTTVKCLAVSTDGTMVASGSSNNVLQVFRLRHPWAHELIFMGHHYDTLQEVTFSSDGDRVASCDKNGNVQIWRLPRESSVPVTVTQSSEQTWQAHQGRAYTLSFHPDREQLVTGGQGSQLARWSLSPSVSWIATDQTLSQPATPGNLAFSADSRTLLVTAEDGLQFWDIQSRELQSRLAHNRVPPNRVAVSPNGQHLVIGNGNQARVEVWRKGPAGYHHLWESTAHTYEYFAFSPDGAQLVAANWSKDQIVVYETESGRVKSTLPARQTWASEFSPDGRQLAFTEQDHVVLWDWNQQLPRRSLRTHLNTVTHVIYSPNGQKLASCGHDRRVVLWDPQTGEPLKCLMGQAASIEQLAFVGNDRLISRSADGSLFLWHADLGVLLCRLRVDLANPCHSFALSPDHRWLAIRLLDSRIELLDLSRDDQKPQSETRSTSVSTVP